MRARVVGSIVQRRPMAWIATLLFLILSGAGFFRSFIAERVVWHLERRCPRAEMHDGNDFVGVIALGGNSERVREAGRLASLYPNLTVLVSGAGTRSEVLGLLPSNDASRVLVESESRTTYENALFSSKLAHMLPSGQWLLVTSAWHMPRAIGAFRKQAVSVHPWPIFDLSNASDSLTEKVAKHEAMGLLAYWVLGRMSALLPLACAPKRGPIERTTAAD